MAEPIFPPSKNMWDILHKKSAPKQPPAPAAKPKGKISAKNAPQKAKKKKNNTASAQKATEASPPVVAPVAKQQTSSAMPPVDEGEWEAIPPELEAEWQVADAGNPKTKAQRRALQKKLKRAQQSTEAPKVMQRAGNAEVEVVSVFPSHLDDAELADEGKFAALTALSAKDTKPPPKTAKSPKAKAAPRSPAAPKGAVSSPVKTASEIPSAKAPPSKLAPVNAAPAPREKLVQTVEELSLSEPAPAPEATLITQPQQSDSTAPLTATHPGAPVPVMYVPYPYPYPVMYIPPAVPRALPAQPQLMYTYPPGTPFPSAVTPSAVPPSSVSPSAVPLSPATTPVHPPPTSPPPGLQKGAAPASPKSKGKPVVSRPPGLPPNSYVIPARRRDSPQQKN